MKKLSALLSMILLAAMCLVPCAHAGQSGAWIGTLTCIGMTEDDVKQWTADVAAAEGKESPYVNPNTIIFYDSLDSMILALKSGKIDRFSIGGMTARYAAEHNDGLAYVDRQHKPVLGYCIAMPEEGGEMIERIDAAISAMKADGVIEALQAEYFDGQGAEEPIAVALPEWDGAETIRIAVTGDLPPMDLILADGTPAGFNTAFLVELSNRLKVNFELVSIHTSARAVVLSSGVVDALFWTRGVFDEDGNELPYPLDRMEGITVSKPYLQESRDAVTRQE